MALVWANSPWQDGYDQLWSTRIAIDIGGHGIDLDLRDWINDGLMAIFFFVVGLEIKRELVEGELRDPDGPPCRRSPRSAGWSCRR